MEIIHIINSLGVGGAERQLSLISSSLQSRGVKQTVIPLVTEKDKIQMDGCVTVVAPSKGSFSVLRAVITATKKVRSSDSSIIVAWMYHSWFVALLTLPLCRGRAKLFFYCRHGDIEKLKHSTRLLAMICLWAARRFDIPVVFNSHYAKHKHRRFMSNVRSFVVPNGVEIAHEVFREDENRPAVVGFLGRNHHDKGADFVPGIVQAVLQANAKATFVVAGPGMAQMRSMILSLVENSGGDISRVHVLDSVEDTAKFLASLDVLVVPSRSESFPNIVVEAMSAGVLVASTSVGDIPIILDGLLETTDKPAGVAELAAHLSALPAAKRAALGNKLIASTLGRYKLSLVVDQHMRIWLENG